MGLDWGEARIGVAACDPAGTLAFPVATVAAGPAAYGTIRDLIREYEPLELIVGLPRSLSGGEGPAAARVRTAAAELAARLVADGTALAVRLVDERLTHRQRRPAAARGGSPGQTAARGDRFRRRGRDLGARPGR